MTVRTVSNLPAAMHVETARCLFAIELSKESWVIGFITPLSAKISRRFLSGGDWKGLVDLIEELRARHHRQSGAAAGRQPLSRDRTEWAGDHRQCRLAGPWGDGNARLDGDGLSAT